MEAPIFIFSLPRSGSTLLQRVLMAHKDIYSVAEPWVLLPQLFALKQEGSLSIYSHRTANQGVSDFINNLPEGAKDYNQSLSNFIFELYEKQCQNNERYFLDKTPRYYLVIDEIATLFPEAKFIFLFRNPVHIYASFINTWGNNRLKKIHRNNIDISLGFELLSQGYLKLRDKSISIKYEDLVDNPQHEIERLTQFLDIDFNSDLLTLFNEQTTNGALGDPSGKKEYAAISANSLNKWKTTLNSSLRKKLVIKQLKNINEQAYQTQGYNRNDIISELKQINNKKNIYYLRDLSDYYISSLTNRLRLNLSKDEFIWAKKRFLS